MNLEPDGIDRSKAELNLIAIKSEAHFTLKSNGSTVIKS